MSKNLKNVVIVTSSIILFFFLLLLTIKLAYAENFEIFQDKNKIYINNNNRFESNYSIIFHEMEKENEKIQINLNPYKSKNFEIPKDTERIIIIKKTHSILSPGTEIVLDKKSNKITGNSISGNFLKTQSFNFAILIICLAIISLIILRIIKNERKEL